MAGLAAWTLVHVATPAHAAGAAPAHVAPMMMSELSSAIEHRMKSPIRDFYQARDYRPLWIGSDGRLLPAARMLADEMNNAGLDALDPDALKMKPLLKAIDRADDGDTGDLANAEVRLSLALADYVQRMRAAPHGTMNYESDLLEPTVPTPDYVLQRAAAAPSLDDYVSDMGWMHPLYAPMRKALLQTGYTDAQRMTIAQNLDRIRAIPVNPARRYVLVDTASARLWMYENGKPADTMKVVVGKPDMATPLLAGYIRQAIVNPYWNIPPDLVQHNIAPRVLTGGRAYIDHGPYEVLDGWGPDAKVIDPMTVDWQAVADGTIKQRVRQLPGGSNFMGKVKYEFPNELGIYLHDTPEKNLLKKTNRQYSSGCVRLENAQKLGNWLMGRKLSLDAPDPEERLDLPAPVPVYITYLTAMPQNGKIVFRDDVYGRDTLSGGATRMASAN